VRRGRIEVELDRPAWRDYVGPVLAALGTAAIVALLVGALAAISAA
jgi:hypothetical protein